MEEVKCSSIESSGEIADNELSTNYLLPSQKLSTSMLAASSIKKPASWIGEFCFRKGIFSIKISHLGNEIFCIIDRNFIEDEFNLIGLDEYVPEIKSALFLILDLTISGIL